MVNKNEIYEEILNFNNFDNDDVNIKSQIKNIEELFESLDDENVNKNANFKKLSNYFKLIKSTFYKEKVEFKSEKVEKLYKDTPLITITDNDINGNIEVIEKEEVLINDDLEDDEFKNRLEKLKDIRDIRMYFKKLKKL